MWLAGARVIGRYNWGWRSKMSNRATETAVGPMAIVAGEQNLPREMRLVDDDLAYRFLPSSIKAVVKVTQLRPFRNLLFNITEKNTPGIYGSVLRRKRYIDDKLAEGLSAGVTAVVNLGAGLDTRAYRLPALRNLRVFEVDLPENIEYKRARVRQLFGRIPEHVALVPVDFDREDLAAMLASHGHKAGEKTFFIWEAVTQYLREDGVRRTMDYLAKAQAGSRLVFTYVVKDFINGTCHYGLGPRSQAVRVKELTWHFGLEPGRVAEFLAEYAWREVEQMGKDEATAWYPSPAGRTLGVSEIERSVYAEKL